MLEPWQINPIVILMLFLLFLLFVCSYYSYHSYPSCHSYCVHSSSRSDCSYDSYRHPLIGHLLVLCDFTSKPPLRSAPSWTRSGSRDRVSRDLSRLSAHGRVGLTRLSRAWWLEALVLAVLAQELLAGLNRDMNEHAYSQELCSLMTHLYPCPTVFVVS